MYQAASYLKPNLTMRLFANSNGIMICLPSQEKSGVSNVKETVNNPVDIRPKCRQGGRGFKIPQNLRMSLMYEWSLCANVNYGRSRVLIDFLSNGIFQTPFMRILKIFRVKKTSTDVRAGRLAIYSGFERGMGNAA